jgi:hypothetical protein
MTQGWMGHSGFLPAVIKNKHFFSANHLVKNILNIWHFFVTLIKDNA